MSSGDRRSPGDGDESTPTDSESASTDDHQAVDHAGPSSNSAPAESGTEPSEPVWRQLWTATDGPLLLLREVGFSFGIVLLIGLLLFSVSGVWPPMVAVESESMEPNINQYDLVIVTEPGRFAPETADRMGVVTADSVSGSGYTTFNRAGSVVVYDNPESFGPPVIHRAHFYVEAGENWYDEANPDYVTADSCDELEECPAPHAGYITKGDNDESNARYDQANGIAPVVKPGWVTGIAHLRIPRVGYIRLALTGAASFGPLLPAGLGGISAGAAVAIGRRELLR